MSTRPTLAERKLLRAPDAGCKPGQRMLHGRPYTFNADLLKLHAAEIALRAIPADLSSQPDDEIQTLHGHWLTVHFEAPHDPAVRVIGERICRERSHRETLQLAYGPVVPRPASARVAA